MNRANHLATLYQASSDLLGVCAMEGRQPSEMEMRSLEFPSLRREPPMVRVHSEAATYQPPSAAGGRVSFFRDMFHAQFDGDPDASARLDRHRLEMRAAGTTTTGAGVVPPTWLPSEYAILAHGDRPWADSLRRIEITNANPVNIGRQTAGAVVGAQANQNDPPSDGSFVANTLATTPATLTGKVDVSRQLVDGSNPVVDGLIYADCLGAYNEQVELAVVSAFEALPSPVRITAPTNLVDALADAGASLRKHRRSPGQALLCSVGGWAYLSKLKDTAGRPLITTGNYGPTNAVGIGQAAVYDHIAGEASGLYVIPTWALSNDNHIYVAKADDYLLLESPTVNFRYEEVLGPEAVRLGVWGYAAPVLGRYSTSSVLIDMVAVIPAPQ